MFYIVGDRTFNHAPCNCRNTPATAKKRKDYQMIDLGKVSEETKGQFGALDDCDLQAIPCV